LEQDVLQGYRKRYGRLFKRGHKEEREEECEGGRGKEDEMKITHSTLLAVLSVSLRVIVAQTESTNTPPLPRAHSRIL
jgi:hypothetical protein